MKVVQINATCGIGSTGKICVGISEVLNAKNIESYILCTRSNGHKLAIPCSDDKYVKIQALKSRLFGNYGFNSGKATRNMIRELERIKPDIVHVHNIHGHDCNIETLFEYFRARGTKLIWTFHDCWAFTGYCTYFDLAKCNKWQTECGSCVKTKEYSWFFDRSKAIYTKKKSLLQGLDLTIVTPSKWLADVVGKSYLKDYPVEIINNGIDLDVFKPTASDFREKYGLENKKLILGVSFGWDKRKGLDVFIELSKRLPDDYRIILVGTDEGTDRVLPDNILSIHRTHSQKELAEIYSASDVFVNPTREENYPTVNMESLACGTPVVTFKTGGSPEMIDATCGSVVDCDDVDAIEAEIIRICTDDLYSAESCTARAAEFDKNERFKEYLSLYEKLTFREL